MFEQRSTETTCIFRWLTLEGSFRLVNLISHVSHRSPKTDYKIWPMLDARNPSLQNRFYMFEGLSDGT